MAAKRLPTIVKGRQFLTAKRSCPSNVGVHAIPIRQKLGTQTSEVRLICLLSPHPSQRSYIAPTPPKPPMRPTSWRRHLFFEAIEPSPLGACLGDNRRLRRNGNFDS